VNVPPLSVDCRQCCACKIKGVLISSDGRRLEAMPDRLQSGDCWARRPKCQFVPAEPVAMSATEPMQQSYLGWIVNSLGFPYAVLLPLAGVVCFVLVLATLVRGRGAMATVSLLLIVHVPLLIGVFAALQGAMASYAVIAQSETAPRPAEIAAGISTALVAPTVGMLVMAPSYFVAALGALVRSLLPDGEQSGPKAPR
jgi:hypothetical protein